MRGKISFIFDDGFKSAYTSVYPIFQKHHMKCGFALLPTWQGGKYLTLDEIHKMQDDGFEMLCHGMTHKKLEATLTEEEAFTEIVLSKKELEKKQVLTRLFVAANSMCAPQWRNMVQDTYEGAFLCYQNSKVTPIEQWPEHKPCMRFEMFRNCLNSMTLNKLKSAVDLIKDKDLWLVFYDHDIGVNGNVTEELLEQLLSYIEEVGVEVLTPSMALEKESCVCHRIRRGYDGKRCLVHARTTPIKDNIWVATAQYLNVQGNDLFKSVMFSFSYDDGKTFEEFHVDPQFVGERIIGDVRQCGCDFTPFYDKKRQKVLVVGQNANYEKEGLSPINGARNICYFVLDPETKKVSNIDFVEFPFETGFQDGSGTGSGQIVFLDNGNVLVPFYHKVKTEQGPRYRTTVAECTFDGQKLVYLRHGNTLDLDKEDPRGIYEPSIIQYREKFYMTSRSDLHGTYSVSEDGLHYSRPRIWHYSDGKILENYNTQQHFFVLQDRLYLVYTRKGANNDHVFRHRAPLFASPIDTETMSLIREEEIVVVPERGARLGNFSAGSVGEHHAFVMAAEWMQPIGCEKYGSDNSIFLTIIQK